MQKYLNFVYKRSGRTKIFIFGSNFNVNKKFNSGDNDSSGERSWNLYFYLLTYSLTPWSRVLLEKLTGSAASQEIPRIL